MLDRWTEVANLDFVVVAEDGKRCFIQWSEGWRGGNIEGTRNDGAWVLTEISSWISQ